MRGEGHHIDSGIGERRRDTALPLGSAHPRDRASATIGQHQQEAAANTIGGRIGDGELCGASNGRSDVVARSIVDGLPARDRSARIEREGVVLEPRWWLWNCLHASR